MPRTPPRYRVELYEDEQGRCPVHEWLTRDLRESEATILGMAMRHYLQELGPEVVRTRYGRALGQGLFEFRFDDTVDEVLNRLKFRRKRKLARADSRAMLLRVFFAVHGESVVLLLGGYDKGRHPAKRRQQHEIQIARTRLARWKFRQGWT